MSFFEQMLLKAFWHLSIVLTYLHRPFGKEGSGQQGIPAWKDTNEAIETLDKTIGLAQAAGDMQETQH